MTEKMWGSGPFWGLGYEWDPEWVRFPFYDPEKTRPRS